MSEIAACNFKRQHLESEPWPRWGGVGSIIQSGSKPLNGTRRLCPTTTEALLGASQLVTRPTRHTVKSCDELTVVSDGVVTS